MRGREVSEVVDLPCACAVMNDHKDDEVLIYNSGMCCTLNGVGVKMARMSRKELAELEKLAPRISEYFELWEEKAGKGRHQKF